MDDFEFDEPKKRPTAPPMAPAITITIGSSQPSPLGALEELAECEEDGEYTDDLDDYSKPNPMRALKAMMKG